VTFRRVVVGLIGGLCLVAPLIACSDDGQTAAADARVISPLDAPGIPGEVNGLVVAREDIAEQLGAAERPYLDAAALFSMREADTLQATLQIGRFADPGRIGDDQFRDTLINLIGGGAAREIRVGDHQVFLTAGDRQQLAVWFADRYIYVLSTRDEYLRGRALLRSALELAP
jgi:hypothetical protein